MNFRHSLIIAELWRPEVARLRKKSAAIFAIFGKNDLSWEHFRNSVPKGFIATPIDMLCATFVKFGRREIGKTMRHLCDKKNKISSCSPAFVTKWIAPKICHGQPQTVYSEFSRFHPNHFTFGGVIPQRVNTIEMRPRVFPIFD